MEQFWFELSKIIKVKISTINTDLAVSCLSTLFMQLIQFICTTVLQWYMKFWYPCSFNFQLSSHILHVLKNLNYKHRVPGQSCSHSDLGTVPWTSGIHFCTPCPWLRCMEAGQTYPLQAKQKHSLLTKWNMHSILFAMNSSIQHEMQYLCILTIYERKTLHLLKMNNIFRLYTG